MILIIDNYDSFVYNLSRYVALAGGAPMVMRNDALSVQECLALSPTGVILSPGPKTPAQAGLCLPLLAALPASLPVLGVCLGHQCLVEHFGGQTVRAIRPLHGQSSAITHTGEAFFSGLPSPLQVGRYHSLISIQSEYSPLIPLAHSVERELMAVRHNIRPWYGVQFHPESILTPDGFAMVRWFTHQCIGHQGTGERARHIERLVP
ncbi:MAG: aminodeoxychorismate/anthranilate synthase component II [Pseudomonadota bacterium]